MNGGISGVGSGPSMVTTREGAQQTVPSRPLSSLQGTRSRGTRVNPQKTRQARIQVKQTLEARINNGFKVHQQIQADTAITPVFTTDIRDYMTFLTARAGQNPSYFSIGFFNLPHGMDTLLYGGMKDGGMGTQEADLSGENFGNNFIRV